jgi:hypothetical protein
MLTRIDPFDFNQTTLFAASHHTTRHSLTPVSYLRLIILEANQRQFCIPMALPSGHTNSFFSAWLFLTALLEDDSPFYYISQAMIELNSSDTLILGHLPLPFTTHLINNNTGELPVLQHLTLLLYLKAVASSQTLTIVCSPCSNTTICGKRKRNN